MFAISIDYNDLFSNRHKIKKPMVGFIAGVTAPKGRRMGHAGAIVSSADESAEAKIKAMEEAGIKVAPTPSSMGKTLFELLKKQHD